jgi:hypothetical protein
MAVEQGYSDKEFKALVTEVKKNPGNSERHYSEVSGIPMGQIGKALYKAEVEANPSLKIAPTGKAIVAAVKKGTLRWPRIAAYAGISVGEARKLYEAEAGHAAPSNVTGRGRPHDGTARSTSRGGSKTKTSGTSKKAGTSGRRSSKTKSASSGSKTKTVGRGRRGTRASAADPK